MKKEYCQKLYDDLYSDNSRFKKLSYDVFENTDISKKQTQESKSEMQLIANTNFHKIIADQKTLELFEYGLEPDGELKRNKYDLNKLDQFDWVIDSFLHDLKKVIDN